MCRHASERREKEGPAVYEEVDSMKLVAINKEF
jgi:hypothetical protein